MVKKTIEHLTTKSPTSTAEQQPHPRVFIEKFIAKLRAARASYMLDPNSWRQQQQQQQQEQRRDSPKVSGTKHGGGLQQRPMGPQL